jgi:hypothetical protein
MNDPQKAIQTLGNKSRELWRHTLSAVANCEIAYEKEWTKGTNRYSWPFRNNMSPERESQNNC